MSEEQKKEASAVQPGNASEQDRPVMVDSPMVEDIPDPEDTDIEITQEDALEGKGALYTKVYNMTEDEWKKAQTIFGVLAGLIVSACLFLIRPSGESTVSWNFLIALAIALLVPRFVEKKLDRRTSFGQRIMLIVLAIAMVAFVLYTWLTGGFSAA